MMKKNVLMQSFLLLAGLLLLFSGFLRDSSIRRLESDEEDDVAPDSAEKPKFDTKDRFVVSTVPRPLAGEDPARMKHIKFHLHCVADAMKKSDFHTILFTSDEYYVEYINSSEDLPIEVHLVEPENELMFTEHLKKMFDLHPDAKGYGFFNGDICPTPGFVDAANAFFEADCPDGGTPIESKWRFVSGLRHNVHTSYETLDLENALDVALQMPRDLYTLKGVDIFAWNRNMFLEHILPDTPQFKIPLLAADNFLYEDGISNALTLLPEHGWREDAIILHLNHYEHNGMPRQKPKEFKETSKVALAVNNQENKENFDKTTWKTNTWYFWPMPKTNNCIFDHTSKTFTCNLYVGECSIGDINRRDVL